MSKAGAFRHPRRDIQKRLRCRGRGGHRSVTHLRALKKLRLSLILGVVFRRYAERRFRSRRPSLSLSLLLRSVFDKDRVSGRKTRLRNKVLSFSLLRLLSQRVSRAPLATTSREIFGMVPPARETREAFAKEREQRKDEALRALRKCVPFRFTT